MADVTVSKTVHVDVDVDLDDFDDDALLDELVSRGSLTRRAANVISDGRTDLAASVEFVSYETRADVLQDLMTGRRREALVTLERALGRDFIGQLA